MSFSVPDAIEPVVGWRCFDVIDGLLVSPQQRMPWPPSERARASCGNARWSQTWEQQTPEQREATEMIAEAQGHTALLGQYVKYLMPDGSVEQRGVFMPWGMQGRVDPIPHYPEEGKDWVLVVSVHGHDAPEQNCSCGIHIARSIDLALQYRGNSHFPRTSTSTGSVFATSTALNTGSASASITGTTGIYIDTRHAITAVGLVKGWGRTIPASHGFRVEFAYPEKLFLFNPPHDDLGAYGVPIRPVTECPEYMASIGVDWLG